MPSTPSSSPRTLVAQFDIRWATLLSQDDA
jgi:hypothetical protein